MSAKTLPIECLQQLFTQARTFNAWQKEDVSNDKLHELYDLMKWGPTSANSCPARVVFVRSVAEKDRLLKCVSPFNAEKVKAAQVTAIIAQDEKFYEFMPKLFGHAPAMKEMFEKDRVISEITAFRNSSLQGAYFMLAARAVGLDCGPMSGFMNEELDQAFFSGTSWKSNFICNLGYGEASQLLPRLPRLSFEEACKII